MGIFNLKPNKKNKPVTETEERLKTDFVSLSSHQLRTPLSAIKWFTEILLNPRTGKLNKKQQEYLKEIYRSNERAIALVNDLLQVSRVQEGKLHLDIMDVELTKIIDEAVEANRSQMTNNEIKFHLEVINGPLPKLKLDKVKVRRIVQTLLTNAVKYTPRGGDIDMVLKKMPDAIQCSIRDSGVGIPQDEQHRIFEKFFRSSNATRIQPDGTGLGLFIAKSLVEAHKGNIWFESEEGKGSTFYFTIPLKVKT